MTSTPCYITDKRAVLLRLRRIEGQVRGLQHQVEDDTYGVEILTQVAAATKALQSVALMLLDQHLQHCLSHPTPPNGTKSSPRPARPSPGSSGPDHPSPSISAHNRGEHR